MSATISSSFKNGNAAAIVKEGVNALEKVPDGKSILRYVFNHDVMSENPIDSYYGSINALPAAYVCASMLNGTPLIYSGMDAEGLSGKQSFFNYKTISFSDKFTPVYKAINDAFKSTGEVRRGELIDYSSGSVLAFTRAIPGHSLLVVVNCSGNSQDYVTPMSLRYTTMNDLINGGSINVPLTISLPAYGYSILMN